MENKTTTEIICILDKSGSMQALQQETIEGLNQFVKDQQKEAGICNFTLVQFNHEVTTTLKRVPVASVPELTTALYEPNGYTALLDAVGFTLKSAMEIQFYLPAAETPDNVIVFIITDGMENASRRYSKEKVKQMVEQLTVNKGWEFQFYGANIDAFGEAQNLGISRKDADSWDYNKEGLKTMMKDMSQKSTDFRKRKI